MTRILRNSLRRAVARCLGPTVDAEVARRVRELLDGPELRGLVETRAGQIAAAEIERHLDAAHQPGPDPLLTPIVFTRPERVHAHETAVLNNALLNVESGEITVEEYAFFGHNVSLLTGTHDVSARGLARQKAVPTAGRDIVVRSGAWIGSNATVLGPAVIGEHAVVAAGAVVTGDVPPYGVVAGVPARLVKTLPESSGPPDAADTPAGG